MSPVNDNQPVPPTIDPHRYDHLIPTANRLLKTTAYATWRAMKFLVITAFRIPGWVRRHTKKEATISNSPKA